MKYHLTTGVLLLIAVAFYIAGFSGAGAVVFFAGVAISFLPRREQPDAGDNLDHPTFSRPPATPIVFAKHARSNHVCVSLVVDLKQLNQDWF